jgi:hypothetical protein
MNKVVNPGTKIKPLPALVLIAIVAIIVGSLLFTPGSGKDVESTDLVTNTTTNITSAPTISPTITPADGVVMQAMEGKTDFATRFDYPVGWPDAKGYHDLQSFQQNNHLGEDWNDLGGCNNDLGKPVAAIADGYVYIAKDHAGGWGNVVRIIHKYKENNQVKYVESVYAHLKEIKVQEGQKIKGGELIGTIGNAGGIYCAHLHLELRTELDLPLGGGYSTNTRGYTSPTDFIKKHRKL